MRCPSWLGCQRASLSAETDRRLLQTLPPFDVHCLSVTWLFGGVVVFSNVWRLCARQFKGGMAFLNARKPTPWPPCYFIIHQLGWRVFAFYFLDKLTSSWINTWGKCKSKHLTIDSRCSFQTQCAWFMTSYQHYLCAFFKQSCTFVHCNLIHTCTSFLYRY